MPQQPEQFQPQAGPIGRVTAKTRGAQALRLLAVLALGTTLAACGRCGDFLGSSQSQIGACHSDPPPQ
jgi:hypothetical protein